MSHKISCILTAVIMLAAASDPSFALHWWDNDTKSCETNAARKEWGTPGTVAQAWQKGKGFTEDGKPDMTFWIANKEKVDNGTSDAHDTRVMVYMARIIVEHGGYFCPTQIYGHGHRPDNIWRGRVGFQNPGGEYQSKCFWLCEPEYSGEYCKPGRISTDTKCKNKWITKDSVMKDVSYRTPNYSDGNIDNELTSNINIPDVGTRSCRGIFSWFMQNKTIGDKKFDNYTVAVFLGAKSFLPNGHGIIASPASVTAFGGTWTQSDYSDNYENSFIEKNISAANMPKIDLAITYKKDSSATFIEKTLCMPGWDGPGCTSSVCHDTQISQQQMQDCYPNRDPADFHDCVMETCKSGVKDMPCITRQRALGTKKCIFANFGDTVGKWGDCEITKKKTE